METDIKYYETFRKTMKLFLKFTSFNQDILLQSEDLNMFVKKNF